MSSNQITIFLFAFMMLIITSCSIKEDTNRPAGPTPTPEPTWIPPALVIDTGLAYGIPCKPPCWQGLVPGKTTHQEAVKILEEFVANGELDHITDYPTGIHAFVTSNNSDVVFVSFEDDVLRSIEGNVNFYYPLKSLIEQFNPPEGLYLIDQDTESISQQSCQEWTPPEPVDSPVMSDPVHLLYPELGAHFIMLQPIIGGEFICPEMRVVHFCYYEPLSMSEVLQDNFLSDLCGVPKPTERELIKWHGFGDGY